MECLRTEHSSRCETLLFPSFPFCLPEIVKKRGVKEGGWPQIDRLRIQPAQTHGPSGSALNNRNLIRREEGIRVWRARQGSAVCRRCCAPLFHEDGRPARKDAGKDVLYSAGVGRRPDLVFWALAISPPPPPFPSTAGWFTLR
jgi:hypothetical protein